MDMAASTLNLSVFAGNKQVNAQCRAMRLIPEQLGARHSPMSHYNFFKAISTQVAELAIPIVQTIHTLSNNDDIYFGMAELHSHDEFFIPVLFWQSSHNQRVSARLFVGAGIRDHNNVVITSDISVLARQTGNYDKRMPEQIKVALHQFNTLVRQQNKAFSLFRRTKLVDMDAECSIVEMIRQGIIPPSKSHQVIEHWDNPEFADLEQYKTVWRLFNAVAQTYKPKGDTDAVSTLIDRSPMLVNFCKDLVMERL